MDHILDLWMVPLSPPPHGVLSDFSRKSDMIDLIICILSIMLCLTVSIICLRFWANRKDWRIDDYCAVFTSILTLAAGAVLIPYTKYIGKQNWDLSLGLLLSAWHHRMTLTLVSITNFALFSGKCCVLTMYHRIFGPRVRYQIFTVVVISLPIPLMGIAVLGISVPRPGKPWRSFQDDANMLRVTTLTTSVFSLVVDVLILLVPIPLILGLNLTPRRKAGVLAIFLTGLLAIVSSVVATYYRACLFRAEGGMRYSIVSVLCICIEASTSVIVSSMPAAAKVWKCHIIGSSFHAFLRAKTPAGNSTDSTPSELPSDIREAKDKAEVEARRKRRRGPFSLPSVLLSSFSAGDTSRTNELMAHFSVESMQEVPKGSCSKLNDPSKYMEGGDLV